MVVRDDIDRAVAAYSMYDVLLVNPVFDGMNLVAMEGPTVNRTGGVLVLSRNAGADELLGRHALSVNPFDLAETVDAMRTALEMPEDERTRRATGLRRTIAANPPAKWVELPARRPRTRRRRTRFRLRSRSQRPTPTHPPPFDLDSIAGADSGALH